VNFTTVILHSGSTITLIGADVLNKMGVLYRNMIKYPYVKFYGVAEETTYYAFRVPIDSLPLGEKRIKCSYVYVPFSFMSENYIKFIVRDKYLVGTDILNLFQHRIAFKVNELTKRIVARIDSEPNNLNISVSQL
jgi:hypothetical protein